MSIFDIDINRKGTFCTQWDYTADRFGNNDVLPFAISDMDFEVPCSLRSIISDVGVFGYTRWRHKEFKNSVFNWYKKRFDYHLDVNYITYSPTVIFSLAELLRINNSSNILLFTPCYDAFDLTIKSNGCKCHESMLLLQQDKYVIDKVDFEQKIKTIDTLLFCSPHNPIGKIFSYQEISYVVDICKKNNVYIISDEIHMDITFGKSHIPILKVCEKYDYDKACIITSASKSFNFPGLVFSYALIMQQEIKEKFEYNLKHKNGLSSCSTLGLLATMHVYDNCLDWLCELNSYIYTNYCYVIDYFEKNNMKLFIHEFDATYLLWVDARYYSGYFSELKDIMYNETKVGIMDGSVYKMENFLRINIGCSKAKLEEGLERLNQAINILKRR